MSTRRGKTKSSPHQKPTNGSPRSPNVRPAVPRLNLEGVPSSDSDSSTGSSSRSSSASSSPSSSSSSDSARAPKPKLSLNVGAIKIPGPTSGLLRETGRGDVQTVTKPARLRSNVQVKNSRDIDIFLEQDRSEALPQLVGDPTELKEMLITHLRLNHAYKKMIEVTERQQIDFSEDPLSEAERAFYAAVERAYYEKWARTMFLNRSLSSEENKLKRLGEEADTSKSQGKIWQGAFNDKQWVIKPLVEESEMVTAVHVLNINRQFPRILDRGMLYHEIGSARGDLLAIAPETTFAFAHLGEPSEAANRDRPLVLMIEKVGGASPMTGRQWINRREKPLAPEEKGNLARDLTRMQYLDYLLTQVDRQIGNYMVVTDANGKVLGAKAIDNDYSLATNRDLEAKIDLKPGEGERLIVTGILLFPLPPIADQATRDYFNTLTIGNIRDLANGRLTEKQLGVVEGRLQEIKEHLAKTEIIGNDAWHEHFNKLAKATGWRSETYFDVLRTSDTKDPTKKVFGTE